MAYQGKRVYGERSRGRRRREGAFARSIVTNVQDFAVNLAKGLHLM